MVHEWINEPFEFFYPIEGVSQFEANKLIGQTPKFDIEGVPAGQLKIVEAEKVPGGVKLKVHRINYER